MYRTTSKVVTAHSNFIMTPFEFMIMTQFLKDMNRRNYLDTNHDIINKARYMSMFARNKEEFRLLNRNIDRFEAYVNYRAATGTF